MQISLFIEYQPALPIIIAITRGMSHILDEFERVSSTISGKRNDIAQALARRENAESDEIRAECEKSITSIVLEVQQLQTVLSSILAQSLSISASGNNNNIAPTTTATTTALTTTTISTSVNLNANTGSINDDSTIKQTSDLTGEFSSLSLSAIEGEAARLRQENEELKRQNGFGYLLDYGLPQLGAHNVSTSEKPSYGNHKPIEKPFKFQDAQLGILSECKLQNLKRCSSKIWMSCKQQQPQNNNKLGSLGNWSHESDIQNHVRAVLIDAIQLAGLSDFIDTYLEVTLTLVQHLRADIVLFKSGTGTIIGVCEVKKPSKKGGDLSDETLCNQIGNYLFQLHHLHGVQAPFGIISTYNEWRVCWLESSHNLAQSTSNSVPVLTSQSNANSADTNENITLYATQVFKRDDKQLIEILVTTVKKMYSSPIDPPKTLLPQEGERRRFAYVCAEQFSWVVLPCLKQLTYSLPTRQTKSFYFLQDYHGGRDGRVWLSVTGAGNLVVIKLSPDSKFNKECENWNAIWGVSNVFCTTLYNANALILPFAFHARRTLHNEIRFRSPNHWTSDVDSKEQATYNSEMTDKISHESLSKYVNNPQLAAEEAITAMVEQGYVHQDIAWRHVALLPQRPNSNKSTEWTVKPILIDLHQVRKLTQTDEETKSKEIQKALDQLKLESD